MTASEIIAAFGGLDALAALTGADRRSVKAWRRNGIPPKFWIELIDAAAERGLPGITADALKATKRSRPRPERRLARITIRHIEDELAARLQKRAASRGHSVEVEARNLIRAGLETCSRAAA